MANNAPCGRGTSRNDYGRQPPARNHGSDASRQPLLPYNGYGAPPPPQRRQDDPHHASSVPSFELQLRPDNSPNDEFIFRNICAVSSRDFNFGPLDSVFYVLINDLYVFSARALQGFPQGKIGLSSPQRQTASISWIDTLNVKVYNPSDDPRLGFLAAMELQIEFANETNQNKTTTVPYDQDELATYFITNFPDQIFAPNQKIVMDHKSYKLIIIVKSIQLSDIFGEKSSPGSPTADRSARGLISQHTSIIFVKAAKSAIVLKASDKRPAPNAIVSLNFKFDDMGIGGLDSEFNIIFRRAFASRIFPPSLIEKMGLQHVRGMLLYGPPGTGKTLIARQIGKMLGTEKIEVVNGPEVLNKYVGQSEENIRKIFKPAVDEQNDKGDASDLHLIIFDEIDAICKQRGSGAAGGTGVGDSVVNQLLSKLDGVEQLNNILLIGMTNRKDMLDDALLRPGRLEVHVEISLPDEHGRQQILSIHTQKMRSNKLLGPDVDLAELASMTKNFSGAEISGLVRAAQSFAFARHTKVGTVAGVSDDVDQLKVMRQDFMNGFQEIQPAFGVSEEDLIDRFRNGIIQYSDQIQRILDDGDLYIRQMRNSTSARVFSVLFHGPPGSGKTALAAKIAMTSGFPFIKLISPRDIVGFNETMKVQHLIKVFDDAYKSPLNIIVIDDIEKLIDWQPIGPRFQNAVLATLNVLLDKEPPKGRKLLIFATTTQSTVLKQLDVFNSFSADITVPNVSRTDELEFIMNASGAFDSEEISRAIDRINRDGAGDKIGIGIKRVLNYIEGAKQDANIVGRFAELMVNASKIY